jgi:hypothetical protein
MTRFNIILFFLLGVLCVQCGSSENRVSKDAWEGTLTSDAESIERTWINSDNSDIHLIGAFETDNQRSLSGANSIRLDHAHTQGFAFEITGLQFLDQVTAKVWRHTGGHHSELSIHDKSILVQYAMPTGRVDGDWEELQVQFNCYSERALDTLMVQCIFSGTGRDTAWFDDFSCEVTPASSTPSPPIQEKHETLQVNYDQEGVAKLSAKRDEAVALGVLISAKTDLVNATINDGKAAKLRLKGDWPDHLLGEKWSMRIEVKAGEEWNEMPRFSIQNPVTKRLMNEWVFHKLLAFENVLTTKYSFAPVELNGTALGIMATEEHFTSKLISQANKPAGPILKFNEDHLWELRANKVEKLHSYPIEEAAEIEVYSRKSFTKTAKGQALMQRGRDLLFAHQHNLLPLDSIFNVDLLAKYFAISELMGASHSYIWHNLRYYYNSEIDRLEPIGIDGNCSLKPSPTDTHIVAALKKKHLKHARILNLCASDSFRVKFLDYLTTFTTESYLARFFKTADKEYNAAQELLSNEYQGYAFSVAQLNYRAAQIHDMIEATPSLSTTQISDKVTAVEIATRELIPGVSVLAYQAPKQGDTAFVSVVNYHHEEIRIVDAVGKNTTLEACANAHVPSVKRVQFLTDPKTTKVKVGASGTIYEVEISKYTLPSYPR